MDVVLEEACGVMNLYWIKPRHSFVMTNAYLESKTGYAPICFRFVTGREEDESVLDPGPGKGGFRGRDDRRRRYRD